MNKVINSLHMAQILHFYRLDYSMASTEYKFKLTSSPGSGSEGNLRTRTRSVHGDQCHSEITVLLYFGQVKCSRVSSKGSCVAAGPPAMATSDGVSVGEQKVLYVVIFMHLPGEVDEGGVWKHLSDGWRRRWANCKNN